MYNIAITIINISVGSEGPNGSQNKRDQGQKIIGQQPLENRGGIFFIE